MTRQKLIEELTKALDEVKVLAEKDATFAERVSQCFRDFDEKIKEIRDGQIRDRSIP